MYSDLKLLSASLKSHHEHVKNEAQTRRVLVDPLLDLLGFNTSNPLDVEVEYVCDVGTKKGEKVDYALKKDGQIVMLVEAKSKECDLDKTHISQLLRYYGVSTARIALLTNGLEYQFFTDMVRPNVLDDKPFFTFNILHLTDSIISTLGLFTKSNFDAEVIYDYAVSCYFQAKLRTLLLKQATNPTPAFTKFIKDELGFSPLSTVDIKPHLKSALPVLLGVSPAVNNFSLVSGDSEASKQEVTSSETESPAVPVLLEKDIRFSDALQLKSGEYGRPLALIINGVEYPLSFWYDTVFAALIHASSEGKLDEVYEALKLNGKNNWLTQDAPNNNSNRFNDKVSLYINTNATGLDMLRRTSMILNCLKIDHQAVTLRLYAY